MKHLFRGWLLAGLTVLLIGACSDDAVLDSPDGGDDVEVQPDAAVSEDLSDDLSTGVDTGDEQDLGEDLDLGVDASDPDPDMESVDVGAGELSCTEVLQCILGCPDSDTMCTDTCRAQGTPEAQGQSGAFLDCVDDNCPEELGITELAECIEDNCSTEQSACVSN